MYGKMAGFFSRTHAGHRPCKISLTFYGSRRKIIELLQGKCCGYPKLTLFKNLQDNLDNCSCLKKKRTTEAQNILSSLIDDFPLRN